MIRIRRNNTKKSTTTKTAAKNNQKVAYTTEEITNMVRTRAYYLYEQRQTANNFAVDHTNDWLTAEAMVRNELGLK